MIFSRKDSDFFWQSFSGKLELRETTLWHWWTLTDFVMLIFYPRICKRKYLKKLKFFLSFLERCILVRSAVVKLMGTFCLATAHVWWNVFKKLKQQCSLFNISVFFFAVLIKTYWNKDMSKQLPRFFQTKCMSQFPFKGFSEGFGRCWKWNIFCRNKLVI